MPKCTLRSPKTINGGIGKKKRFFFEKNCFLRIFFYLILCHLGPRSKKEANGCHGCIRNEFPMRVGTHEIGF